MVTKTTARLSLWVELREFLNLAVPLAAAQVAQAATEFISTLMMGHLGSTSLAAGGLASTTFQFLLNVVGGVAIAVNPLLAAAHATGQKTQVEQLTRQGLWLSLMLSIPLMLVVGHLDTVLMHLGQAAPTVALTNNYLDWALWGAFPALGFTVLRGLVSVLSQAHFVTVTVIGGLLVSVVSSYGLGYGKFGLPRLELAGLGIAISLSYWIMFLALLVYVCLHSRLKEYRFWRGLYRLKLRSLQRFAALGMPIAASTALESGLFTVVTYLMGLLGSEVLAAHQAVYQTVANLIFMVPLGISYATAIRVGYHLGQQDLKDARQAGYVSISVSATFMALMAIVLLSQPQQVVGLFLDIHQPENANILKLAVPMLIVAALSQFLDGVQSAAAGGLYGLQDMRAVMRLSLLAFWGVGLTSGCLLGFYFGLGGVGLWIGQSIGMATGAGLFVWRFHRLTAQQSQTRFQQ